MTLAVGDRIKMSVSGTPGTGTITLGSPVTDANNGDYQSFASGGILDGTVVSYGIYDGHNWEVGHGTYTASGTTLTRGPSSSSAGGAAISCTSNAIVFVTALAGDLINFQPNTISLPTNTDSTHGVINIGGAPLLITYGTNNIFLGVSAGNFTLTGQGNIGFGAVAGQHLTSGSFNTFIAAGAGTNVTTGNNNFGLGTSALTAETDGGNNVAIGASAMVSANHANGNVCIGTNSGYSLGTSGVFGNTFIGPNSGFAIASGSANTVIGSNAGGVSLPSALSYATIIFGGYSQATANTFVNSGIVIGDGAGNIRLDWGLNYASGLRLGGPDVAAPSAVLIGVPGVVAGTSNTAGQDWTFLASAGTGNQPGGKFIFSSTPAGTSGTGQNGYSTLLSLGPAGFAHYAGGALILDYNITFASTLYSHLGNAQFLMSNASGINLTYNGFGFLVGNGNTQFIGSVVDQTYDYQTPTTGQTVTLSNTKWHTVIDPATNLSALTVVTPASAIDGTNIEFQITKAVASLTINPNSGQSILGGPPSTISILGGTKFTAIYKSSNTTWYFQSQVPEQGYDYNVPTAGATYTLTGNHQRTILDPAGTLSGMTVKMDASPTDGAFREVRFGATVTTLTVSGNTGQSVKNPPATVTSGGVVNAVFRSTNNTWYF